MSRRKSDSQGSGKSKGAKGSSKAKPKGKTSKSKGKKGGPKRKYPSYRGATAEARKRAAGLIPSKNFVIMAGDPLKAQIVAIALQRPYAPSDYAREFGVPLQVASYCFKVLRERNIIELVEKIKVRGSTIKHMYRANEAALVRDADWGELAEALRPLFTGTILHDFSTRVTQSIETGHLFSRDDFCLYWAPQELDDIAWEEQVTILRWCIEESKRLEVDTVNRRAKKESEGSHHTTFAVAGFLSPTHEEYKKHMAKGKKGKGKAAQRKMAQAKAKSKNKVKPKGGKPKGGKGKRKAKGASDKGRGARKD